MARSKPAHQWETRLHLAVRSEEKPVRGFEHDSRAEAFELHFHDGRRASVRLGLSEQHIDAVAASDPDLLHAVQCWLCARGERSMDVRSLEAPDRMIARGTFSPADLSSLPGQAPARLITLCPSNAEMVHALDCFDRVIACEDSSDYPAMVSTLERLGPDLGPDLDRVAALTPDLVVSSLSVPGMERNVTGLWARGIPQIVLAPRSVADVMHELGVLASALGVEGKGREQAARMQHEVDALRAGNAGQTPLGVYLEWWPKPMFTPGSTCYSNELIALAGGRNVFGDKPGSSLEIKPADLIERNPQVCFVSWCGVALDKLDPDNLKKREGLGELAAAKRGAVFPVDERFSGRPGPRMLEAARVMAEGIQKARRVNPE